MPANLRVYGFGGLGPLPDLSPFVHKVENVLRLGELDYDKRIGDARRAPRNKLPFIEHEGEKVTDSQAIVEYLHRKGLIDLDAWLSPEQRAEATALRSLLECDFYFCLLHFRWSDERSWAVVRSAVDDLGRELGVPGFLRPLIARQVRKQVLAQAAAQGAGRREPEELRARAVEQLEALSNFVARHDGPWWFGERPSSHDALAHAFMAGILRSGIESPFVEPAQAQGPLMEWFEHADAELAARAPAS